MKPLIIWEKWIDPFGRDQDEAKWIDYENNLSNIDEHIDPDEPDMSDQDAQSMPYVSTNSVKVIASPLGLIPYNEHTASSKIFNFWLGHTNFNISTTIKDIIEEIDGVEILDIFTRYRFRIAIGKCFEDADVINNINIKMQSLYENTSTKQ